MVIELRATGPAEDRRPYLPLLLLADDAEDHVRRHLAEGQLFVVSVGDDAVGAVQAVPRSAATVELTLVAVAEAQQGRGVGRWMLAGVVERLAAGGASRVLVGTSSAGVGQLAFYQKAGFRVCGVERDYFDAARGYDGTATENGIVHRDLVWLDLDTATITGSASAGGGPA